jgi:hypothetical protein
MNNDVLASSPIVPRNWRSVLTDYETSAPYNYAVMDDFLAPDVCQQLHQELLTHLGWRYQNHPEQPVLSNMAPEIETIFTIAASLKTHCPYLFADYELVDHWALMYPQNGAGKVHSDIGSLTVNIWLTPEQYNLDLGGGGLIFFDVKRDSSALSDRSLPYLWSEQYLKDFTKGQQVKINYKCNRALLLDARTFHQTDDFCFANLKPESHRINLSLAFDNPVTYRERVGSFKEVLNKTSNE